jgi:hypothetical protein
MGHNDWTESRQEIVSKASIGCNGALKTKFTSHRGPYIHRLSVKVQLKFLKRFKISRLNDGFKSNLKQTFIILFYYS